MFTKIVFFDGAEKLKRAFIFAGLFVLLSSAACYQRFERLTVKSTGEGIVFTHPKMEEAQRAGNLCVFGEISVSRQSAAGDAREETWSLQNTASGFQQTTEPMSKPYIVYGEKLPQTRVIIEPKPLREGAYRVNGVVGIYNSKRELLDDLSFNDEFVLKNDADGKLTVSAPAEK